MVKLATLSVGDGVMHISCSAVRHCQHVGMVGQNIYAVQLYDTTSSVILLVPSIKAAVTNAPGAIIFTTQSLLLDS
jgi:hypothetical protein